MSVTVANLFACLCISGVGKLNQVWSNKINVQCLHLCGCCYSGLLQRQSLTRLEHLHLFKKHSSPLPWGESCYGELYSQIKVKKNILNQISLYSARIHALNLKIKLWLKISCHLWHWSVYLLKKMCFCHDKKMLFYHAFRLRKCNMLVRFTGRKPPASPKNMSL